MTAYLALMLGVMIPLVLTSFFAVKAAAGRMQTANALDQAMFSLFGHFDRDLMERYDLYFIDGGFGTDELHQEVVCDFLEEAMSYVLTPEKGTLGLGHGFLDLRCESSAITGYTLASDQSGAVFALQAEMASKETLLTDGASALLGGADDVLDSSRESEERASQTENALPSGGYDDVRKQSEEAAQKAAEEADAESKAPEPENVVNPLESMDTLRKSTLLQLVCPAGKGISSKSVEASTLYSHRRHSAGMGTVTLENSPYSIEGGLLLNRYISEHFGCFTKPEPGNGLDYPLEQILKAKNSDQANLEAVVRQLMLVREGINLTAIYADAALNAQLTGCASAVAAMLLIPEFEPVIKGLMAAGWAYCESLLDVRTLLDNGRVPLVKSSSSWQVPLENIPQMVTNMDGCRRPSESGLNYQDYLGVFLMAKSMGDRINGAMDMVEHEIRADGRPSFHLDHCFDSFSVEEHVISEGIISLTAEKTLCYRDLS